MANPQLLAYIARHGSTELNSAGKFRGTADVDLDKEGVRDAHKLAYYFEPLDISRIVASARKRSMHTAEIINQDKDLQLIPHEGLFAWNVGHLSGKEKSPENVAEVEWHVNHPDVPIPGGESLNEFSARIRPLLLDAAEMGMHEGIPPLIVAHSSVIHEAGSMFNGGHTTTLVKPGGVCGIFIEDGHVKAEPIFKPDVEGMQKGRADNNT